jgi:hypothetical protein
VSEVERPAHLDPGELAERLRAVRARLDEFRGRL